MKKKGMRSVVKSSRIGQRVASNIHTVIDTKEKESKEQQIKAAQQKVMFIKKEYCLSWFKEHMTYVLS